MTTAELVEELGNIERERLRVLVEARMQEADALHAPDFALGNPSGEVWSKDQYLGGIASGHINYRRFEAVSKIDVMVDGDLAVLRYRSAIDIAVHGQEPGPLECWHLDCYRRDEVSGSWRVRWSQATFIS
jgi:Domain of unknown function (DUF4440)